MFEEQQSSQASFTRIFKGSEDDVVDGLLSILKRDHWENLKMHYEMGTLSCERTELRTHQFEDVAEEVPLTFALSATWFESDREVEVMIEVTEPEHDWTQDECSAMCASILTGLKNSFQIVLDNSSESVAENN